MRVEQLVGSYTSNQRQARRNFGKFRPLQKGNDFKGAVLDVVCLSVEEGEQDFGWFCAYVRRLPDDVVAEKIKQIFHSPTSNAPRPDDLLVEKLLFEIL
jgi:hypothetical protein